MHSRLSRLIVLFAMLVCLPLNGLAALAMPACGMHGQAEIVHADHGAMAAMPGCEHHDAKPQPAKTPCDKCFSCHVASGQAILPFVFAMAPPVGGGQFAPAMAEKPQSLPSSPFRPPIPAFA